jgi:restriction endonuclease Mrr
MKAHRAVFVTTSSFTDPAIIYANTLGIDLIDGKSLYPSFKKQDNICTIEIIDSAIYY